MRGANLAPHFIQPDTPGCPRQQGKRENNSN
jgi:hypothetical protein